MSAGIDWIVIDDFTGRQIGALGFIRNRVAVVAAFYDDADGNQDGSVGVVEWVSSGFLGGLKNRAVTQVAMAARLDMDVLGRDPSFHQMAGRLLVAFASDLVEEAVYKVYLSRSVAAVAKPIANRVVSGTIKEMIVRKGMEKAVEELYGLAVG